MGTARASAVGERLHRAQRQEDGSLLLDHIRRRAWAANASAEGDRYAEAGIL